MSKTTVDELKAFYVKLGGNIADVANVQTDAEMIKNLNDIYEAFSLPEVTAEDNGDVLTVVEGEWAKATPSESLPSVTSADEGDVLTVNNSGEWVANALPKELYIASATTTGTVTTKLYTGFTVNFGKTQKDVYDEYVASGAENAIIKVNGGTGDTVYFSIIGKPTNKLVFGLVWVDTTNSSIYFHKITIESNGSGNTAATEFAKYTIAET